MNATILRGLRANTLCHHPSVKTSQFIFLTPTLQLHHPRYGSTTSPSAVPGSRKLSSVNGPASTLPPLLSLPTRAHDQAAVSYYFQLGKSYLTFYKTGIKHVYQNLLAARALQQRLNEKYKSISAAVKDGAVNRSEFQLRVRNWHDAKRLPLFGLVILVCGEFTPLVVVAISNVVPWTCRIPKQIESDRKKLEARRSAAFRDLAVELPDVAGVEKLSKAQLRQIHASLGLSSRMWDWVGGIPNPWLTSKVRNRLEYLELDDTLIRRGGGLRDMEIEEVKMALVERGVDVLGKEVPRLNRDLSTWLYSREKGVPMERLLLTRPSVWPVKTEATPGKK